LLSVGDKLGNRSAVDLTFDCRPKTIIKNNINITVKIVQKDSFPFQFLLQYAYPKIQLSMAM